MQHAAIPKPIRAVLDASGCEWYIEERKKHVAIKIGDCVVTYISRNRANPQVERNRVADVKRFLAGKSVNRYQNVAC